MTILGISAYYHDAAAALLVNGEIIAAAQEERFTRKKHDASFPTHAIRYCLDEGETTLNEVDAIVFYDKPLLKFERLLETYYAFAPKGLASFVTAMPVWIREKLFIKRNIRQALRQLDAGWKADTAKLLFPEHHLSHAASAFYPSPFERAAILTIDGVGEWATASICLGEGNQITVLKELQFPHSLGLLYSAFTYYCGFKVNAGEYKLMGLAPYGDAGGAQVAEMVKKIRTELVDLKEDGSLWLNPAYFRYATGLRMVHEKKWQQLFGFPRRTPEAELTQTYCNLAMAIQIVTEDAVIMLAKEAQRLTGANHLCLAGGVALNCVANGKLDAAGIFDQLFIQPAAGDAGGALGAALAAHHIYFGKPRRLAPSGSDTMKGGYLGPRATEKDIRATIKKFRAAADYIAEEDQLLQQVAGLLAAGKVIGWHQGRMEFGPRALGARSIIADARNAGMQKNLNLKIKFRESFRPFAPIVPVEDVAEYFDHSGPSPYMLLVKQVVASRQNIPPQSSSASMMEQLYFQRSDIPAVTHVDYSARIQTVHRETNLRLWKLLQAFKQQTGYSVLVNTSFNVRGEPIVHTAEDAYRCFMRTEMDYLVVGNYIFDKTRQPVWTEKDDWRTSFTPD